MNYHELLLIGAAPEASEEAARWVEGACQRFGISGQPAEELAACVVEAVNNSIEHAYPTVPGEVTLMLTCEAGLVRVIVSDRGDGIPPSDVPRPEAGAPRGRGRWIMSQWCDSVTYERGPTSFRAILTKQCTGRPVPTN